MSKLENPKHEEFALLIARGVKQGEAYKRAGYTENKGAASRLASSIVIQDRVDELRKELMEKVNTAIALPTNESFQTLAEMGLTLEWVALQFKTIYTSAVSAGSFSAANTAVENIKKLIDLENNSKPNEDSTDTNKFNMKDMLTVLDKVADVVAASKQQPEIAPAMLDITPKDD